MSRHNQAHAHPRPGRPLIIVHDHDVLSGRGVHIAQHPGNERFRALVTTRADNNYCTLYSLSEKRAVAEDIIRHIKALDPPGRFLRRDGRCHSSRGLNGPWEELSDREAVKKTCQALRDCNRSDRTGYAAAVEPPDDVRIIAETRSALGMTNKQYAEAAVARAMSEQAAEAQNQYQGEGDDNLMGVPAFYASRPRSDFVPIEGRVSPSVENAAEWLKRQRTEDAYPAAYATTRITPSLASPDPHVASLNLGDINGSTEQAQMPSIEPLDAALSTPLAYHQDPQVVAAAFAAAELFANTPTESMHPAILHAVTTSSPSTPMGAPYPELGIPPESVVNVPTPSSDEVVVTDVARELQGMGADLAEAAANAADAVEAADDAHHHRVSLADTFDSHHHHQNVLHMEEVVVGEQQVSSEELLHHDHQHSSEM